MKIPKPGPLNYLLAGLMIGIPEIIALLNETAGDTASELMYGLPWWGAAPLEGFLIFLVFHIAFGWWKVHKGRKGNDGRQTT